MLDILDKSGHVVTSVSSREEALAWQTKLETSTGLAHMVREAHARAAESVLHEMEVVWVDDIPVVVEGRLKACMGRLGIDHRDAAKVIARDVTACEAVAAGIQAVWDAAEPGSCCKPALRADEYAMACEHLLALWCAKEYLTLAQVGAPAEGAWPCYPGPAGISCGGSKTVCGRGHTENGVFRGATYTCPRCLGKGFMNASDKRRCETFDANYTIHI